MNSANSMLSTKPTLLGNLRASDNAPSTTGSTTEDVDMSLPVSSDDEPEEDEFDEDEYAASEAQHQRNIKVKEAGKPPPFLFDSVIRGHLIRLQFLNMIANDLVPRFPRAENTTEPTPAVASKAQLGLPSPEEQSEDDAEARAQENVPHGRFLRDPPINPIPTPPIEDLPYLQQKITEPFVFDESDDDMQQEAVTMLVRQEFERAAFDRQADLQQMHEEYRDRYASWKQDISYLDRANRDIHMTPAPASPAPSAAPSVTPLVGHERTRGGRNTTEADLQAAIALSEQTMKEEEERREREAQESAVPNDDHEAVVLSMLSKEDAHLEEFFDTSGLVTPQISQDLLRYIPPEDDFNDEEQLAFTQAYCQTPKKWGKMAESLPGRDFKQCISHYYLTKGEAKYKEIWRRAQPKRKRGRIPATKPRSTALMSELTYRDGEEGAVAVTDTGRPRRAAAPTFGDNATEAEVTAAAQPAKRLAVAKDAASDGTPTKAARKGKTGTATKTRRTKAQMLEDKANAQLAAAGQDAGQIPLESLEKSSPKVIASGRDRARTLLRAEEFIHPILPVGKPIDLDQPQYAGLDDKNALALAAQATNQPTSYWSVPEQQKFPQLVAYFGRDFAAIADFMKTKTSTMVSCQFKMLRQN
jgi:hypothetical protein